MHCFFKDSLSKLYFLIVLVTLVICPAVAQPSVLTLEQLGKLTPEKIDGYRTNESKKGRILQIGTLSYSMIERTFVQNKKQVNILLFDYNNASIMYRQATQKWKTAEGQETDSMLENAYQLENQSGWMQYDKNHNRSQITLGIQNRFFLVLKGEGISLSDLDSIAKFFDLARFPAQEVAMNDPKHR
jgi:hypothetical protein